MKVKSTLAALGIALSLAACGSDEPEKVDSEDYTGPSYPVASKRIDPEVRDVRTKTERYCTARKDGKCTAYGSRVKTEYYVSDDKDWVLVLNDGTPEGLPVDVDEEEFNKYEVGQVYP